MDSQFANASGEYLTKICFEFSLFTRIIIGRFFKRVAASKRPLRISSVERMEIRGHFPLLVMYLSIIW